MLHPLGVLVLVAIQWYAFARNLAGRPSAWKGRLYRPPQAVRPIAVGVASPMNQPARSPLPIGDEPINLTQVLKRAGWVMSGGEAKSLIADGQVLVNGEVELRKRRQMKVGDIVSLEDGPTVELIGRGVRSVEPGLARADAFQVRQGVAAGRQLRVLHEHVGDLVLDREPRPAARADERLALQPQGCLADRADEQCQQILIDHRGTSSRHAGRSDPHIMRTRGDRVEGNSAVRRAAVILARIRRPV